MVIAGEISSRDRTFHDGSNNVRSRPVRHNRACGATGVYRYMYVALCRLLSIWYGHLPVARPVGAIVAGYIRVVTEPRRFSVCDTICPSPVHRRRWACDAPTKSRT